MLMRRMAEPQSLTRLRDEMDRLFERFFGEFESFGSWGPFGLRQHPAANLWQDDDNLYVEAELAGLAREDIELTVAGNELTIKGARPEWKTPEGVAVHRRERATGSFNRVVHLPLEVDAAKVQAEFCNGVLTITLPKAELARARHIPVKALTA